ncbi:hypothetical protein GCM10010429_01560 [Micromonospora olivasterospora]
MRDVPGDGCDADPRRLGRIAAVRQGPAPAAAFHGTTDRPIAFAGGEVDLARAVDAGVINRRR